jgi:hypothetical protein
VTTALIPVDQVERMAHAVAKSGLFGVKTPDQAMALMLISQAEGLHPALAARDYHVINGRPTLRADAMLARFQQAGGKVEWGDYTDARVVGTFSHPAGGSVRVEWTLAMAQSAGLTRNPTWKSYPRQMLRARCISEGIRTVFPGVVVGTYTPEEAEDMSPQAPQAQQRAARDMGDVEVVAPTPVVDVGALIEQIQMASTLEFLETLRPQMRQVPKGPDRDRVVQAVQRRAEEIRAEQTPPVDPEVLAAEEGVV